MFTYRVHSPFESSIHGGFLIRNGCMVMPAGRPRKIKTVAEFQRRCDAYFEKFGGENTLCPTITDLALSLGYANLEDFRLQGQRDEKFSDVVKNAISRVSAFVEAKLLNGGQPAASIFWLCNHGWRNPQQHEHTGSGGESLIPKEIAIRLVHSTSKSDPQESDGDQ